MIFQLEASHFSGLNQFPNLAFNTDFKSSGARSNAPQSTVINTYTFNDNLRDGHSLAHAEVAGYNIRRVIAPQFFVQRVRGPSQLHDFWALSL